MMRKKLAIIIICLFILGLKAQYSDYTRYYFNNFPKTPSTALFEKYGTIQNSEYTGTNGPSIPLFSVKSGDISFPLVIKYVSGNGIKIREEASNVGLGWGMPLATISQQNQGFDDFSPIQKLHLDFLYNNTPPTINNWLEYCSNDPVPSSYKSTVDRSKFSHVKSVRNMLPINGYFKDFNTGFSEYDTAPDVFVCNLFGESFIFVTSNFQQLAFNNNTTPTFECINKKGYKIFYNNEDLFIITGPDGVKYYFSKTEVYGMNMTPKGRNYVITKIIDKNNNIITFEYNESVNNILIPFYAQSLNLTTYFNQFLHADSSFPPNIFSGTSCVPMTGFQKSEYLLNEQTGISPLASNQQYDSFLVPTALRGDYTQDKLLSIKKISGDFGVINFNYSDREDYTDNKKLDNIIVNSYSSNKEIKKIVFNYSYFSSQNSITARDKSQMLNITSYPDIPSNFYSKRLKLNSLTINDTNIYSFAYDSTPLVDKDSFAVDYWGYFNGGISNQTLFANPNDFNFSSLGATVPLNNYNNNKKTADINYAKAGVLTKIIYPTKGFSTFTYELNTADNLFDTDFASVINSGHGIRLSKQINYDSNNEILNTTIFRYEGGKALNPLDIFKKYNYKYDIQSSAITNSFEQRSYIVFSTLATSDNPTSPYSSGDIVGYSSVIKEDLDKNLNSKGNIVTSFYNTPDIQYQYKDDNLSLYMPNIRPDAPENGLIKEVLYNDDDNLPVRKIVNDYKFIYSNNDFYGTSLLLSNTVTKTNACVVASLCYINGVYTTQIVNNPIAVIGYYPIFSKVTLLDKTYDNQYFGSNIYSTTKSYSYNSNNFITNENETYPDGTKVNLGKSYATEWNLQRLLDNNIVGVPIYESFSSKLATKEFLTKYEDINHLNATSVIKTNQRINGSVTTTDNIVKYTAYDTKGNLLEYKNNVDIPTTIIWGYNKTQPIAKIEGAKYNDISSFKVILDAISASDADALDSSKEGDLLLALSNIRTDSNLGQYFITTYTYDPLIGVTSITPPSGMREIYKYDFANRLQSIVDVNGNILKEFKYNYQTPYYNSIKNQTFIRNNCESGYTGGSYTYTVPLGKYSSMISQADADSQADAEINLNGQNEANTNGLCIGTSCYVSFNYLLGINGGGGVSVMNNINYKLTLGFSSGANSSNLPWTGSGVKVATINGNCRPKADYSSYNGQLYYTIKTNGDVIIKTSSILPNNTSYNYEIYYPIN